jgi:hypothetical protein
MQGTLFIRESTPVVAFFWKFMVEEDISVWPLYERIKTCRSPVVNRYEFFETVVPMTQESPE